MVSNSLKNPGKILEFCGCGKVGTLKSLNVKSTKINSRCRNKIKFNLSVKIEKKQYDKQDDN